MRKWNLKFSIFLGVIFAQIFCISMASFYFSTAQKFFDLNAGIGTDFNLAAHYRTIATAFFIGWVMTIIFSGIGAIFSQSKDRLLLLLPTLLMPISGFLVFLFLQ